MKKTIPAGSEKINVSTQTISAESEKIKVSTQADERNSADDNNGTNYTDYILPGFFWAATAISGWHAKVFCVECSANAAAGLCFVYPPIMLFGGLTLAFGVLTYLSWPSGGRGR